MVPTMMDRRSLLALPLGVAASLAISAPVGAQALSASLGLAPGESLGHALELSAATNLRDLGGYRTGDGKTLVRGLVYRSDVFNPMTAPDLTKLGLVGLRSVFDLRTIQEVKVQPDQVPADARIVSLNVLADAQSAAPAQLEALLRDPKAANAALGGGKIEAHFAEGYREFVSLRSAQHAYRTLYLALADKSNLPAVFHCTTGKDRTGWAAAALLTLLGVPEAAVMADYLRSNDNLLAYYKATIDRFAADGGDRDIPIAILGVKRDYLEASFDEMRARYGTIESYFAEGLGINTAQQAKLRGLLVKEL
ncbi:tyrosine-protein phosphatase [Rhodopseudomonas sp. BR0G17]|uniref:tyrosine-protein phosphatase n=1 Tax=Rhodopseudomonas sp. BR0G17 TaxID=2269368 RepID=UPI0013DE9CFA|nr:tyrosine-protein phosphatase [Rhodopseudomonas sp. BR0G17]NEW97137.1 protein-tyrosine-phosphatase [Rhodopseudomonas sp. BR0G17]